MFFKGILIRVDDETAKLQAIATHRGVYKYKRLAQGIKTAPGEFQRIIDQLVAPLKNVIAYFDDLIVYGETLEECKIYLNQCLNKLREWNLHLNWKKCSLFKSEIEFLGHKVTANGLMKTESKMKAITEAPVPTNVDEVRSFLGLVLYYGKFIPKASELTAPLRELLEKDVDFKWTKQCEKAFQDIKTEICSPRVLVPFNPSHKIILATDASLYGIAAILSHEINGEERPIMFISRSLSAAEKRYSQLDREALGIYWAVRKLYEYLFGYKFTLITDNKPLSLIFSPKKGIPTAAAARLQRYAVFLSGFNYEIEHRKASEHQNVDYLSRAPLQIENEMEGKDTVARIEQTTVERVGITFEIIQEETRKSKEMMEIVNGLHTGRLQDTTLSLSSGVIFRCNCVFIPPTLRKRVLDELHSTHIGITRMKSLARRFVYWPNIDKEIEERVKECVRCQKCKSGPARVPVHSWEKETQPWTRLHIDYAGPKKGKFYFVVVDSFSGWPEVYATKADPSTEITIQFLRDIFSRFGLPLVLVSDNATYFKSAEMQKFCLSNGIKQKHPAPYKPSTNGAAERAVKTLKEKIETAEIMSELELKQILMKWRSTPDSTGLTPAEKLFGRNIRTRMDMVFPKRTRSISNNEEVKLPKSRQLNVGDRVRVRNYSRNGEKWKFGVIEEKFGRLHYTVKLDDGGIRKSHIDQIAKSNVPKKAPKKVTFQEEKNRVEWPIPQQRVNFENQEMTLRRSNRSRRPPDRLNYK